MEGNGNASAGSPPSRIRSNGTPLPPTGPRRPAPPARLPSIQIQRSWDRGEASNDTGAGSTSAAAAAAAAARRRRAATIASPIREYPPHLDHPTSTGVLRPATSNIDYNDSHDLQNGNLERQGTLQPAPGGDGHIFIVSPPSDTAAAAAEQQENPEDNRNLGWGAALMNRGRRRAATTAAALSRTLTGGTANAADQDLGDIEASRRARAASRASVDMASNSANRNDAYDTQVHDMLDVIDPEVQTVNLLGDIQNAFFIPPNRLFDRTRKVQLTKPPESKESIEDRQQLQEQRQQELKAKYTPARTEAEQAAADARRAEKEAQAQAQAQAGTGTGGGVPSTLTEAQQQQEAEAAAAGGEEGREKPLPGPPAPLTQAEQDGEVQGPATAIETEELVLADQKYVKGRYFVLPSKLVDMTDWSDQEKADLDDYVRHLMHNKKEIFRRRMRGFGKYVRTPLGCFVTVYASLLTFWGAAWVLFLIGWLPAGDRQAYFVEICDQILVALFCVTGLGLIPWRIRDTYHAFYIIKYHRKTLKLRKQRGLPKLADDNDLPNDQVYNHDLEMAGHAQDAVLNDEEQTLLVKHQTALSKSHTYYRPHETFTHHAFPLSFLIAIIVLCDCHSCFQLALGSATWSISYHHWYKKILTTIVLCFSLSCNISGGICIAIGSRLSRKKEVVEALLRQAITEEALKRKEDAERYRAEKRLRLEREAHEKEHMRQNSSGGLSKSGSFPLNAVKNAPQKLKLITQRNNSDPAMSEKFISNTRRSSSSARSSLDSPRLDQQMQEKQLMKRSASERLVSSPIQES